MKDTSKQTDRDPKWKKFEKLVAGIHLLSSENAEVKFDDHIIGRRTKSKRQIDVSLRFKQASYDFLVIIECKDKKAKVPMEDVEAFRTKMEDVGAHKGVMVSPKGFQKGAKKSAEAYNIELYTLTEEIGNWIQKIKEYVTDMGFPIRFELDCPAAPGYSGAANTTLNDFVFYDAQNNVVPLRKIVTDALICVQKAKKSLPCTFNLRLEGEWRIVLPHTSLAIPINGMKLMIGDIEAKYEHREIDVPSFREKYIYSDTTQKAGREILAPELPIGVDTILEPGKFYKDRNGQKFKCVSIEGEEAKLMQFESLHDGQKFHMLFHRSIRSACHYAPLNDLNEEKRLEELYQLLSQKEESI